MAKKINILSLDYIWETIEYEIINLLNDYDALDSVDKDTFHLIGHHLLKYIIRQITTCTVDFDQTEEGLQTFLSTERYPFNIFYIDYDDISSNKEILEYMDKETFVKKLKGMIRDFNKITNNRILELKFPYKNKKNISLGEDTKTEEALKIKKEILLQHKQKKKTPIKTILKLCKKYSIVLDELKIRKISCH